jgi:hypothetical protein
MESSSHRVKQIALWMDVIRSPGDPVDGKRLAGIERQDKGGSMAL